MSLYRPAAELISLSTRGKGKKQWMPLDELSLTLAPQVFGRDASVERPGLVAGKQFAPEHSV